MLSQLLVSLALHAEPDWKKVEERDGVTIESRAFETSAFVELRFTTHTTRTPESLCAAAFGTGAFDAEEPDLKSRKILSQTDDERVTYDQISPPVVANRDYAVHAKRVRLGTACEMRFEAANDLAPPPPEGWVRINGLHGYWRFEPDGAQTRVTYVVFSDPGGSVPAFLVEGSRRKLGVQWVKMIVRRGSDAQATIPPDAGVEPTPTGK